jgi:plasmid replication initiation protein
MLNVSESNVKSFDKNCLALKKYDAQIFQLEHDEMIMFFENAEENKVYLKLKDDKKVKECLK